MPEAVIVGVCALAAVSVVALLFMCKALVDARTQLKLEIRRREDQIALDAKSQKVLDAQREALRNEFGALAARLLDERQRDLGAANERSVGTLFRQLAERLAKYEAEVEKAAGENVRLGENMKTQLAALQNFADQAKNFTAALMGGNKIQGNTGESILAGILERSGFTEGREYETQRGGKDEGRPDVSVYDAINRRIILIDAKMNITDYIRAYNLPEDEAHRPERERALRAHVASIRRQIDTLAKRNYAETVTPTREGYTNLPLVAMFCPFNTVLEAALDQDPTLMQYAYDRKIVLVTPLTLWGYLWLIAWGWKQQAVAQHFDSIRDQGRKVVEALDSLLNDLAAMGEALKKADQAYETLYRRATEDKGQLSVRRVATNLMNSGIAPASKLKQLGKILPTTDGDGAQA